MSKIFEPYYTTKKSGTGLGLLIVRRIVREHGGEIEFDSAEGKGTRVTIYLPRVEKRVRLLTAGGEGFRARPALGEVEVVKKKGGRARKAKGRVVR